MEQDLIAKSSVTINAPAEKVWKALIDPVQIKQYLFGTDVESDWKVGSPIRWGGEWQGKKYQDKGTVVKIDPKKFLQHTYWSSMQGKPDKPENYNNVSYSLKEESGKTTVSLEQDGNDNEQSKQHAEQNWNTVLSGLKKLLEGERLGFRV
jgi:uncharacterized protein YndB with AHSA1/START domain